MSGSPHDEVVRAVEWLEESIGLPCERSVAHCISAKFSTSLLPVGRVLGYRRRLAAFRLVKGMDPFFWRALRGILKVLLIRRKWPETMEIDFGGSSQKEPALQVVKSSLPTVCIVASMQSYSSYGGSSGPRPGFAWGTGGDADAAICRIVDRSESPSGWLQPPAL